VAYYEATPQQLLSQSRFIHADFHQLVVELFNADVYGVNRRPTLTSNRRPTLTRGYGAISAS
jgi:hypothetical protein